MVPPSLFFPFLFLPFPFFSFLSTTLSRHAVLFRECKCQNIPERLAMPSIHIYRGYLFTAQLVGGSDGGGVSALCALSLCDCNHIRQR